MKDCSYISGDKGMSPCEVPKPTTKEERYPTFSIWDSEAVGAVFGGTRLMAGEEYDITPMRVRVKRVTSDEKDGISNVELSVIGVGPVKAVKASERQPDDEEPDEEED